MDIAQDARHRCGPMEILILEGHPRRSDEPIRSSILTASVYPMPPPREEALSYTKGSPTSTDITSRPLECYCFQYDAHIVVLERLWQEVAGQ